MAQSFGVKGRWFGEFIKAIELGKKSTWINIIIDNIDFKKHSAFSEYETLGTFISHNYQNEIYEIHNEWYRFGNSTFGNIKKIDTPFMRFIFARYDFVSFEYWDKKQIKRKVKTLFYALIYLLSSKCRQSSPKE